MDRRRFFPTVFTSWSTCFVCVLKIMGRVNQSYGRYDTYPLMNHWRGPSMTYTQTNPPSLPMRALSSLAGRDRSMFFKGDQCWSVSHPGFHWSIRKEINSATWHPNNDSDANIDLLVAFSRSRTLSFGRNIPRLSSGSAYGWWLGKASGDNCAVFIVVSCGLNRFPPGLRRVLAIR